MLPVLVCLKNLIKTKSYHIDFPLFRLHYQVTVCLLLAFCVILTGKVMFGDTIDCTNHIHGHKDLFDNACYATGTFSRFLKKSNRTNAKPARYTYPGLMMNTAGEIDIRWQNYYQYVPIMLFIQAVLFYFPHYLWKIWENGTIGSVCSRLSENKLCPSDYLEANHEIVYYLHNCFRFNKGLVYKYYFCHILLLINLVAQVLVMNAAFNYQYISYGYMCFRYYIFQENFYGLSHLGDSVTSDMSNPMDFLFPKMTNCHLDWPSVAGFSPDKLDFVCILPLNILHDKFYLLLWGWLCVLGALTVCQILYDISYTMLRRSVIRRKYGKDCSLAEAFMLDLIRHNTDKIAFSALLSKLYVTSTV